MFTVQVSMKKPKKPKRLLLLVLVPVAAGCLCAACFHQAHVPQDTATLNGKAYALSVKDGGYREFFARSGLKTDGGPVASQTVCIPEEFDEVYGAYNALQQRSGLDLTPYRGREAEKLSFSLQNPETPCAVLLVYRGCVIGGHLSDGTFGGALSPLLH